MDSDPNRNVGRTDLSSKSDSVPAPRETAPIPAVARPGAGPSSAMVTRSRAQGGRSMSVEPEVEYRPEGEFPREVEIPAETCKGGSETARPTTDTASQYTTADKTEVAASQISQEVMTSASKTPQIPRTSIPHKGYGALGSRISEKVGQNLILVLELQKWLETIGPSFKDVW